jgi:hypothetical protein
MCNVCILCVYDVGFGFWSYLYISQCQRSVQYAAGGEVILKMIWRPVSTCISEMRAHGVPKMGGGRDETGQSEGNSGERNGHLEK